MDRGRAERLEELFDRGLPLETAERRSLLDDVRRGDAELADELASLFTAHEAPGRLEDLAAQLFPDVLDDLSRTLAGNVENLPSVVGHYQLLEPLGQGGMGEVYRARDLSLDRLVALKFLAPHLAADAEARARLKREARAASALDHPNIAVVHEIGTTAVEPDGSGAGRLFIAMAYYSGETIKKKLTRGSLAVADAIDYAAQTADGLAAAHEAGIVHRDIKPANVIVTSRGVAKIVDFGIARSAGSGLTGDGGLLGTIAYMSPEQTRGEPVDCRTDVWSLGAMVYEMLAAQRPFRGDDDAVVIHAIRHDEPKPLLRIRPGIPATLARIIDICLAKDPDARFQHAGALLAALKALQAGDVSEPLVTAPRRLKIRPALRIPILIVFLLAIAGAVLRPEVFGQLLGRAGHPPIVSPDSRMVLVLPFAPASPDPALERIGRDLAVTLTAGLDGMGALRTVDPTPTLADVASGQPLSRDDAHVTAGRRGAGRFIQGALTRAGGLIRLDLSLYATGGDEAIARASVTGDAPALSDRALIALLDQLWQREPPHAPSVAAIRKSQVPEARRAYLEGELALSRRNMAAAVDAFERAFARRSHVLVGVLAVDVSAHLLGSAGARRPGARAEGDRASGGVAGARSSAGGGLGHPFAGRTTHTAASVDRAFSRPLGSMVVIREFPHALRRVSRSTVAGGPLGSRALPQTEPALRLRVEPPVCRDPVRGRQRRRGASRARGGAMVGGYRQASCLDPGAGSPPRGDEVEVDSTRAPERGSGARAVEAARVSRSPDQRVRR